MFTMKMLKEYSKLPIEPFSKVVTFATRCLENVSAVIKGSRVFPK